MTEAKSKAPFLTIKMRARRLGNLSKKATMLYIGRYWIEFIDQHVQEFMSGIPQSSRAEVKKWLESHPWDARVEVARKFEHVY